MTFFENDELRATLRARARLPVAAATWCRAAAQNCRYCSSCLPCRRAQSIVTSVYFFFQIRGRDREFEK